MNHLLADPIIQTDYGPRPLTQRMREMLPNLQWRKDGFPDQRTNLGRAFAEEMRAVNESADYD